MKKKSKKEKKRLIILYCLILLTLLVLFSSVYSDWKQIIVNKENIQELTTKYDDLQEEQKILESEVTKLKDPDYLARYAKEKYLYSSENEIIIRGKQ